ncbi:hypothetical protein CSB37_02830 [bacterium DOLZORAL124_38_8]|nr:MAG: hypothetical protein CSB37_02830 [bacterium DOLZORAL124_38_8]
MSHTKFIRTCLVCGAKKNFDDLQRFVWPSDSEYIVLDQTKKQTGRGGYVCRTEPCQEKLNNPKLKAKIRHFLRCS